MLDEARPTARQRLEYGGFDAAFDLQSAGPTNQRAVRRLPVGATAEYHSALQVASGRPLSRRAGFETAAEIER